MHNTLGLFTVSSRRFSKGRLDRNLARSWTKLNCESALFKTPEWTRSQKRSSGRNTYVQFTFAQNMKEFMNDRSLNAFRHNTGGGSVLMWGCMSAAGVGELCFIDGIMNSQMYCSVLKEKMLPSLLALGCRALFQHDNDPKHTSKGRNTPVQLLDVCSVLRVSDEVGNKYVWCVQLRRKLSEHAKSECAYWFSMHSIPSFPVFML